MRLQIHIRFEVMSILHFEFIFEVGSNTYMNFILVASTSQSLNWLRNQWNVRTSDHY